MLPPLIVNSTAGDGYSVVEFFSDEATVRAATVACGIGVEATERGVLVRASRDALERLAEELRARGSAQATALERFLNPASVWRIRDEALELASFHIMGIVNLTADSFSGDGVGADRDAALAKAAELRDAGACIIDVGAESARAGRPILDPDEEARIVAPVVESLLVEGHRVSIDTYKPAVARAALDAGARIVNDISGLTIGTGAAEAAVEAGAGYVLNYSYSPPKRRPDAPPVYTDVVAETAAWFHERLEALTALGLTSETAAIDPGIAFGKSHDEDIQMLRHIEALQTFGHPVLLAHSRKNFIGSVSGAGPSQRDLETHVASAMALSRGARIFRVHDVDGTRRALQIAASIALGATGDFAPDAESWPWRAGSTAEHAEGPETLESAPPGQRW